MLVRYKFPFISPGYLLGCVGYGDDEDSKKAKVSKNENGVAEPSEDQDTPPPKYTAESKARIETKLAKKKRKSRPITGQ